jgi:threonyl-tRNA synthetase
MLVVGDREAAGGTVALRERSGGDKGPTSIDAFISLAREEIAHKSRVTVST